MALTTPAVDLSTQGESGIKIKKEKEDEVPSKEKNCTEINKFIVNDPQLSELQSRNITITVASAAQGEKSASVPKPSTQISSRTPNTSVSVKPDPPPIDYPSICGAFGWTTIGSVHLPFIMRGEDRFVAVRMVECKIISNYADILPWTVFTCTNIKSYYITENEAKLLNEINGFHCEFQFGYQTFTSKDVVVRLKDTVKFYEFLETCKTKLNIQGANPVFSDHCGYFVINYAPVPFVRKGTKKYVPLNMVYPEGVSPPVSSTETVTEWDLAYLRFLCSLANLDQRKFKLDIQLCCTEDLQNALGGIMFEEWWPNMQYSSKTDRSHIASSSDVLPKWGESAPVVQSTGGGVDSSKMLREKMNEIQDKDSMLNSFLGLNKFLDMNTPMVKPAHATRNPHEQANVLNSIQNSEKASIFPASLENFLATSSSCNYPYPVNYRNQYTGHIQNDYDPCRKADGSLPSLASGRPRPFPPPPPLVRLGGSRVNSVPGEHGMVPKASPSLYPYLPAPTSNASCPPWLARILEPDWLREDDRAVLQTNAPENLSRRLSEHDAWCPTSLSSSINLNGAGSSSIPRSNSNSVSAVRDNYDFSHGTLCRDDRVLHSHGGSPRLLAGSGPPPHYPTPPQSSPLQPLSLLECAAVPGMTDLYATRSTPNGLVDLCSPPPSPEIRTALSNSPRGSHLSNYGYQPHITRLVQVDSRYVLAINIEPLKYNSLLAVPISDVVNKFLRGTSVQSCQIVLETVFGLHLYECTSLQQEAFAKHNLTIIPGSKLVLLSDLKNSLYQLRFLLVEKDKQKEKHCDIGTAELPLSKRWCGNAHEC
ncbi:hypothetical protein X975_07353, partial [Stegodyphus mimosarum]